MTSTKNGFQKENGEVDEWNFSHVAHVLTKELQNQDSCGFLLGGQPLPFAEGQYAPTLVLLVLPSGHAPPPFVAQQNPQQGSDRIIPIAEAGLGWKTAPHLHERASVLEMTRRVTRGFSSNFEYMTLWTMKPATDWKRKEDGTLDLREAPFQYQVGNEIIDEVYEKGKSSFNDFCDRFELDPDVHAATVKEAVKSGFDAKRAHIESRISLLTELEYPDEVLDNIRVVKIVPQNPILESSKSKYYNQYYLWADELY